MGGGAGCVAGRAGRRWARRGAGDEGEIYADLVAGLGEAIVSGMVPGTSLSFTARKDALDSPQAPPRPACLHGHRAGSVQEQPWPHNAPAWQAVLSQAIGVCPAPNKPRGSAAFRHTIKMAGPLCLPSPGDQLRWNSPGDTVATPDRSNHRTPHTPAIALCVTFLRVLQQYVA